MDLSQSLHPSLSPSFPYLLTAKQCFLLIVRVGLLTLTAPLYTLQTVHHDQRASELEEKCSSLQELLEASQALQHSAMLAANSATLSVAELQQQLDAAQLTQQENVVTINNLRRESAQRVEADKAVREGLEKSAVQLLAAEQQAEAAQALTVSCVEGTVSLQVRLTCAVVRNFLCICDG